MNKDLSWWYWAITDLLLIWGLAGEPLGFVPVIAFTAAHVAHFLVREGRLDAFPVQVRSSYLAFLLMGLWEPLQFIYWLQLAGTTAMVLADYCPLARFLSLMPWNRREPLSLNLVRRTFFSAPVKGNILQGLPAQR